MRTGKTGMVLFHSGCSGCFDGKQGSDCILEKIKTKIER